MRRKYFPFYESFLDGAQELPDDQRLQFYDAIARYALKDESPHLTGLALMCWRFAKPNIDSFIQNYDSGKKGGRPRKNTVSPMVKTPVSTNGKTYKDKEKDKEKEQYTATTAHHSMASDSKNSNCHFANSKNALSVSDSESDSVAVVDTTAAPRTDSDLAEIVQHFQQVIGDFPRSALDKLRRYQETFPTEVICRAFDEAAENGVRKWRYVDGILKGWQADGVRTLGDVEARREARMKPDQQPERKLEMLT